MQHQCHGNFMLTNDAGDSIEFGVDLSLQFIPQCGQKIRPFAGVPALVVDDVVWEHEEGIWEFEATQLTTHTEDDFAKLSGKISQEKGVVYCHNCIYRYTGPSATSDQQGAPND